MVHPESPTLDRLVGGVRTAIAEHTMELEIVQAVRDCLSESLDAGLGLDPRFCEPREERYVMYPIYIAPDGAFSIASAVWGVGQSTPIHDHGVWGVVGILAGIEHEVRFDRIGDRLEATAEADFAPGQSVVCCTNESDLHQVACGSDEACVGIHVYGGDIGTRQRHQFDARSGSARPFVSVWPWLEVPQPNSAER
jgi:predicted metal-dependent enzyme (double-stranded beta helix superfamily)